MPPAAAAGVPDDELIRLERLTARRADEIHRRDGEDDRSVWQRAEADVFAGLIPGVQE